ncbi:MAG: efflux RND transporter periplasmic adaptor subunit [Prochlorotrichaceae cyanobacterium]
MKLSRWLIPLSIGVLVVMGVGGGGFWLSRQRNADREQDFSKLLSPVSQTNLQLEITTSGVVQPLKTVNLSPKTAGILTELRVEQGDFVQAGTVLAKMDDRDLQAQLRQAQGRVAEAQARLAELEEGSRPEEIQVAQAQVQQSQARIEENRARLALAQERLQRNQTLFGEGAITRDDRDASQTEVEQAQATLSQSQAQLREAERRLAQLENGSRVETITQAQAQLETAKGQLAALQVQLEDTLIRAPFAGTITQRYADPGAFVTPTTSASATASATSTSIVALAQGLEVLANVPEVDLTQIYIDQPVQIVADSYPNQVFQGKVRLIAPEAVKEQDVTSFQVRVSLVEGLGELRSGMNVDVTFLGQVLKSAIVVPTAAIVTLEGRTGLLVPNADRTPVFRPVVIGSTVGNQTEVLEGLEPEEQVFVDLPPGVNLADVLEEN